MVQEWYFWLLCERGCSAQRISANYEGEPKWLEEACACGAKMTALEVAESSDSSMEEQRFRKPLVEGSSPSRCATNNSPCEE